MTIISHYRWKKHQQPLTLKLQCNSVQFHTSFIQSYISRISLHFTLGTPSLCSERLCIRSLLNFPLYDESFLGFFYQCTVYVHSNFQLQKVKDAIEKLLCFLFWFECSFCRDPTEKGLFCFKPLTVSYIRHESL